MELQNLYKKTAVFTVLAAALLIAATVFIMLIMNPAAAAEGVQENTANISAAADHDEVISKADSGNSLLFSNEEEDSEYIWVPVPDGVGAADVSIENHYMDSELWILVNTDEKDFYETRPVKGNLQDIEGGSFTGSDGCLTLKLDLSHIYEYNTIFEDGYLYVEKVSPRSMYDRIVILDPAGSVPDELLADDSMSPAGICIDIASKLKSLLEEENIRVYITSLDERKLDDETRIFLSEEVKPDMYIRIETAYDSDSKVYGTETVYNGTYFIPGFGSVELADLLEKKVTTSIGGRVDGLAEATDEDTVIMNATVPAAAIKVGYYTNVQENILLNRDDYRTKIANGIYDAVLAGYEEIQ